MSPLTSNRLLVMGILALTILMANAFPNKLINLLRDKDVAGDGGCFNGEQYNQIETINTLKDNYDYYTLTWRQVSDECGNPISSSEAAVFTGEFAYGEVKHDSKGRDQILMFMCSPYGYYEVEIEIFGGSHDGGGFIAWEVEIGPSEEHIWDTWNPEEYKLPKYNPSGPGKYTFPLKGETDPHMALMWAGPDPADSSCYTGGSGGGSGGGGSGIGGSGGSDLGDDSASDATLLGCYKDGKNRVLDGPDTESTKMDAEYCSAFCTGYKYFGTEYSEECFCGDTKPTTTASNCDMPCTGDSSVACGGRDAITVFERVDGGGGGGSGGGGSDSLGCWADGADRIMTSGFASDDAEMTPDYCLSFCSNEGASYYGVEFGKQCFCSKDDSFMKVYPIDDGKCNMPCTGDSSVMCGGRDAMNVYEL